MTTFLPQSAVVWFEIPTSNMDRSKAFYREVTGMSLRDQNEGPNPMAIFNVQDPQTGVAGHLYPGVPSQGSGPTVHLSIEGDLESALDRVRASGGKVVSEVIEIPAGRFAYCEDPDGNSIGLFVTPSGH